ncbi:MAG: zinc-ribbon domain-containing protein [Candidatus Korobacteraceae bacterium]
MEHACKKCGAMVEDGIPFCSRCGAPQVRVMIASDEAATEPLPPGNPDDAQPPAEPVSPESAPTFPAAPRVDPMDRRAVIFSALLAGFTAGLGTLLPFLPVIILSMVAAGGIAVTLYKRRVPYVSVPPKRGFRIGALAGLFGFVLNAGASVLGMLSDQNREALRAAMRERLKEAMAVNSDASAQQMLNRLGEMISTTGGLAALFAFSLLLFGLIFVLLGGLGGSIGAALFGKKS